MNHRPFCFLALLICLAAGPATSSEPHSTVQKDQIDQIVGPLIDADYLQAVVVGVIDKDEQHVYGFGRVSELDPRPPDGQTVFEIGSVSKVFTSLLLAEMSQRGQVKVDDPVQKYLPDSVHLNQLDRPITLLDLSTHRAGLPRMPDNFKGSNASDPYTDYTPQLLYEFLNQWRPGVSPGQQVAYSNLGGGLLGHVLAPQGGTGYEQLLIDRIASPLAMSDTSVVLSASQQRRLTQPHDADGQAVHNWNLPDPLTGAGGIRSTADDMLKFVQAQLSPPQGPLGKAIEQTHQRQDRFDDHHDIAMGWLINKQRGYLWHNGATGGYHSFVAFSPAQKVGLVVLANNSGPWSERAGAQIMARLIGSDSRPPLAIRKPVKLDTAQLDRFVGNYVTMVGTILTIRRESDQLYARMMGQQELRIYPESESTCFWKAVDAQAEFTFGPETRPNAVRLVLHQDGNNTYLARVATTQPK